MPDNHPNPNATTPTPQYLAWWGLLILTLGIILGAAGMRAYTTRYSSAHTQALGLSDSAAPEKFDPKSDLPILGEISDFALTERSEKPVTRKDLAGNVTIVDFIFSNCGGICPIMTSRMKSLQDHFSPTDNIRFVSITVDPTRDNPQTLTRFAARYDADPGRWWFLTGHENVIYRLSRESFRLTVEKVPEDLLQPDMEPVMHSSKFVLLDQMVRIRGYYDGTVPQEMEMLKKDARRLLNR